MFLRGVFWRCPSCGSTGVFKRMKMTEDCPRCGLHFERIEGHWIGAIGVNTIVTFSVITVAIIGSLIATPKGGSTLPAMIFCLAVGAVVSTLFFPSSRMTWTAMDIAMRPLKETDFPNTDVPNRESKTETTS